MKSECPPFFRRRLPRVGVAVFIFTVCSLYFPRFWCGRDAGRWMAGDKTLVDRHAHEVCEIVRSGLELENFTNDNPLFKGEWMFGTYQMAALGLLQVCRDRPDARAEFLPVAEQAIEQLLSPAVREFDRRAWRGEDPIDSLDGDNGHAAYLGYVNLVLSLHRSVAGDSRFTDLNDRISSTLARRVVKSAHGGLETYPAELYPVDNASVLASLLMHQRASGMDHSEATDIMRERFRGAWRDPQSQLLIQAIGPNSGRALDKARASGTALAAYMLSLGEREISRSLYDALCAHCSGSIIGFGYMMEYKDGGTLDLGDVDSGPLIFGTSISGSGFAIASARTFGDRTRFTQLYRTVHFVGAPVGVGKRRVFVSGGPLGNAIMFAMLTAGPGDETLSNRTTATSERKTAP